ncbi:MAG: DNA polymerase III subunit beta [Bacteroidales bacterium]|nr:DNA polymerase III subunit beta [Bacteroidales bacterium]
MKFSINSSLLSQRLQTLGRVINSKNAMPILGNFLFKIADNVLTLTASDNEVYLTTTLELIASDGELEFTVNAKTIQDAIKEIPEQPMEFDVDNSTLEITIGYQNGQYSLMGESAEAYPLAKPIEEDCSALVINSQDLYSSINRALFATGDDQLRPVMNGVYFDYQTSGLSIVASDGRKLACTRLFSLNAEQNNSFNLPKKPANIIKGILQKEEQDITIRFSQRNAELTTEDYKMSCRLIEGKFPNYNSVIPQNNPNSMTVNRQSLISALRRILIFSNVGSPLVKLHIEAGRLEVSTKDMDYRRSGQESLLCEYDGAPMNIGFKGTLLVELLNNLEDEEVIFRLADASRAGIIVPAQQDENVEIVMLLMPMMLND